MTTDYECPVQVAFRAIDEPETWHYGIAYSDVIICGCCGGTVPLEEEEVLEIKELPWINIEEFIRGT